MRTLYLHLLLSLTMSSITYSIPRSIFQDMHNMIEEMEQIHEQIEKRFAQSRHETWESLSTGKNSKQLYMKLKEGTVEIVIPQSLPKDRAFDAQFDQEKNALTISTSAGNILIQAGQTVNKQTYITAILKQQENSDSDKDVLSSLVSRLTQTIEGEIDMGQSTIDYDAEAQELIVTVPPRKKTLAKIPVNFKEPKENK